MRDAATCWAFQNNAGLNITPMISVVDQKMINTSPITRESIKQALAIWRLSIPNLDGKTTRSKGGAVTVSEESIALIPPHILIHHPVVILGIDVIKYMEYRFRVQYPE